MSAYPFSEATIAEAMGIPATVLQTARKKMREGEEWGLMPSGKVGFAEAALDHLVQVLGGEKIAAEDLALLIEKTRSANGSTVSARVTRFFRNPHVIEMELPDATKVNVWVRCTNKLRAGDQGTVLLLTRTTDGNFELAQRLPRTVRQGLRLKPNGDPA